MSLNKDEQLNNEINIDSLELIVHLKREKQKQLVLTIVTMILTLAVTIAAVYAWFARNDNVYGRDITVETTVANTSLFIEKGDLKTANPSTYKENYQYTYSVEGYEMSGGLYPISLYAKSGTKISNFKWWIPTEWNDEGLAATYTNVKSIINRHATKTDAYVYQYNGSTHVAYNLAQYTVYCNKGGELDVYLATGTSIELTPLGDTAKQLDSALRVGIVVDGVIKCVYAPQEAGKGNSKGAKNNRLYVVQNASSISSSKVCSSTSLFKATETDGKVTAGDNKLFTANYDGTLVEIYVWLEGTDAQANYGKSDNAASVALSFHLVGIEN